MYDLEREPSKLLAGLQPSDTKSWHSGGTAHVLPNERKKASFDHDTMVTIIDGSEEIVAKKRWIYGSYDKLTGPLSDARKYDIPRGGADGSIGAALENFMAVHKRHFDKGYKPKAYEIQLMQNASIMGGYPGYGLFLQTIVGQSSGEQMGWWLLRTLKCEITGCYAQTELGHGSNVRGLETTAVFDEATKTFVLDTPTLTSTKFWPSSMVSATHAVVYAQLHIKGQKHGVHNFMVQLRDENFRPLPGIEVGDIGTKLGEQSIDIGYLRMKKVHVPLTCMLAKRAHVTEEGKYVKHGKQKAAGEDKTAYMTMMSARTTMCGGASGALSKACTIATRYAAVRQQGFRDASEQEEVTILDYKFTQYRLLKQLSFAIATKFACSYLTSRIGDFQTTLGGMTEVPADIGELHATSAGMKGFCCERTALGIEDCRKAVGGAGYLMSSGIAALEVDYKWRATAEGDTVVMLLETAKFLIKQVQAAREGQQLSGLAGCLSVLGSKNFAISQVVPPKPQSPEGWLNLTFLLKLFEARTICAVSAADRLLSSFLQRGVDPKEAFAECTLQMMRAGEAHVACFLLSRFKGTVDGVADAKCKRVLEFLCAMFALAELTDGTMWATLLDAQDETNVQIAAGMACKALRPDAVALVDCFEFPDVILNSTIGRYDGNVYEASFEAAVHSPLNTRTVPEWFSKIKPYMDIEYLALRNGEEGAANFLPASKL